MRLLILCVIAVASCDRVHDVATGTAALDPRRVLVVEGEVTLNGQPAIVNAPIGATADITTAKGARAVISVQAGSVIEVRESSHLVIGRSPRKSTSVQLLTGILWNILPSGKADYEVVAPNAVAGVRGTTFFVDASHPDGTNVCVCDGEVDLTAGDSATKPYVTHDEHYGVHISGSGTHTKVDVLGVAKDVPNHPNAERERLKLLAPR